MTNFTQFFFFTKLYWPWEELCLSSPCFAMFVHVASYDLKTVSYSVLKFTSSLLSFSRLQLDQWMNLSIFTFTYRHLNYSFWDSISICLFDLLGPFLAWYFKLTKLIFFCLVTRTSTMFKVLHFCLFRFLHLIQQFTVLVSQIISVLVIFSAVFVIIKVFFLFLTGDSIQEPSYLLFLEIFSFFWTFTTFWYLTLLKSFFPSSLTLLYQEFCMIFCWCRYLSSFGLLSFTFEAFLLLHFQVKSQGNIFGLLGSLDSASIISFIRRDCPFLIGTSNYPLLFWK